MRQFLATLLSVLFTATIFSNPQLKRPRPPTPAETLSATRGERKPPPPPIDNNEVPNSSVANESQFGDGQFIWSGGSSNIVSGSVSNKISSGQGGGSLLYPEKKWIWDDNCKNDRPPFGIGRWIQVTERDCPMVFYNPGSFLQEAFCE